MIGSKDLVVDGASSEMAADPGALTRALVESAGGLLPATIQITTAGGWVRAGVDMVVQYIGSISVFTLLMTVTAPLIYFMVPFVIALFGAAVFPLIMMGTLCRRAVADVRASLEGDDGAPFDLLPLARVFVLACYYSVPIFAVGLLGLPTFLFGFQVSGLVVGLVGVVAGVALAYYGLAFLRAVTICALDPGATLSEAREGARKGAITRHGVLVSVEPESSLRLCFPALALGCATTLFLAVLVSPAWMSGRMGIGDVALVVIALLSSWIALRGAAVAWTLAYLSERRCLVKKSQT